jgi:hypothetical protein
MTMTLMLRILGDDNHKIRGTVAPDSFQVYSVFDILTLGLAKTDKGAYARKFFGTQVKEPTSEYFQEFDGHIYSHQFPGVHSLHASDLCKSSQPPCQ